jgi:type I restriction enzyme M protein
MQHMIHHLAPGGTLGLVLANGSMSSNTGGEGDIRKAIVEADLVDCMVALPGQLFYTTQIPVCLWFLARNKNNGRHRDRRGETLFVDARQMGEMVDRTHRELTREEIDRIAATYHAWRAVPPEEPRSRAASPPQAQGIEEGYEDVPGFCKSATLDEIAGHGYVLTPGRYVGAPEVEDDDEPFEEKMERLTAELYQQMDESAELDRAIRGNLKGIGYGE